MENILCLSWSCRSRCLPYNWTYMITGHFIPLQVWFKIFPMPSHCSSEIWCLSDTTKRHGSYISLVLTLTFKWHSKEVCANCFQSCKEPSRLWMQCTLAASEGRVIKHQWVRNRTDFPGIGCPFLRIIGSSSPRFHYVSCAFTIDGTIRGYRNGDKHHQWSLVSPTKGRSYHYICVL